MTSDRTARNNRKAALVSLSPANGHVHKSNSGRTQAAVSSPPAEVTDVEHTTRSEAASDQPDPTWLAREKALWEEYGFAGRIVPDAVLKECRRRLRAAHRSELRPQLKRDLEILDKLHQYRKRESLASAQAYPAGAWKDTKAVKPTESMRSKGRCFRALIMGNDAYPKFPLGGCVNDANLVHHFLLDYLNVPRDHIRVLLNTDRATMINALYDLRDDKRIRRGDNILIHYSGYGSSYRAGDFFTSDAAQFGFIEAICPVDRSDKVPDISERELSSILSEIHIAKGPNITLIFDCCHSGGALRSSDGADLAAVRYALPIGGTKGILMMFKAAENHPRRTPNTGSLTSEDWEVDVSPFVQLAACQDFQLAQEDDFTGDDEDTKEPSASYLDDTIKKSSTRYGRFTYALIKILKSDMGRNATYESVIERVGSLGEMQVPVVVGSRKSTRLWFEEPTVRT